MILTRSYIAQFQVGYIGRFKVDITFDSIFLTFYAAAALDNRRIYGEISIIFSRIEYDHFMFAKKNGERVYFHLNVFSPLFALLGSTFLQLLFLCDSPIVSI